MDNSTKTLSKKAFQEIKEDIITGVMSQGEKIAETKLAKTYDISRGPLREALQKLEYINLIKKTVHSGSRVITLDVKMMGEIYELREVMEGFAARLACKVMTQAEIDNLYELLDKHKKSIKTSKTNAYFQKEGDLDFHYYIFSKCKNMRLINYINNELYQILRMCRHHTSKTPFRAELALTEHYNITDAINNRDEELAQMLMSRHIRGAWRLFNKQEKGEDN